MGCWNATCAITGLPIQAGNKVRWFIVGAQDKFNHIPLSIGFIGKYDQYGRPAEVKYSRAGLPSVNHDIDKRFKVFAEWAKPRLKTVKKDILFLETNSNITDEYLFDRICDNDTRNRIIIEEPKLYSPAETFEDDINEENITEEHIRSLLKRAKELEEKMKVPHYDDIWGDVRPDIMMIHSDIYDTMLKEIKKKAILDLYCDANREINIDILPTFLRNYSKEDLEEFCWFKLALRHMRKEWRAPHVFDGAQDAHFDVSLAVAKKLPKLIKKLIETK